MQLIKEILTQIENGKNRFEPEDDSIQSIKEFQKIATRIKHAEQRGFLGKAHYQKSMKRDSHSQYITALIEGGLTFEGEKFLNGELPDIYPEIKPMSNNTFNFHNSTGIQIGDGNTQNLNITISEILEKINSSNCNNEEKMEAKKLLDNFLRHPIVSAVVGGIISYIGT